MESQSKYESVFHGHMRPDPCILHHPAYATLFPWPNRIRVPLVDGLGESGTAETSNAGSGPCYIGVNCQRIRPPHVSPSTCISVVFSVRKILLQETTRNHYLLLCSQGQVCSANT